MTDLKEINFPGNFENDKFVFFWSGPFSNWYKCKNTFTVDYESESILTNCSEQAYMWLKAMYFGDDAIAVKIKCEKNPREQKNLGRRIANFDEQKWDLVKKRMMFDSCISKFHYNDDLKSILLATKNKIICEASPKDVVWGNGMHVSDPDILDQSKWKGQNLLGQVLMKVREYLQEPLYEDEL